MARVEISQNIGPDVITSVNETVANGTDKYGPAVNVSKYTIHSYHVITDKDTTFTIAGSNVTDSSGGPSSDMTNDWVTISTHSISAGSPATLAYSDVWNFKYAKVLVKPTSGDAAIKVYEKHNA